LSCEYATGELVAQVERIAGLVIGKRCSDSHHSALGVKSDVSCSWSWTYVDFRAYAHAEAGGVGAAVRGVHGTGRRPSWTADEKAEIVAESYADGDTVCSVARRHGLTPQQLFAWRRQMRQPLAPKPASDVPLFVPAVIELRRRSLHRDVVAAALTQGRPSSWNVEMEIDGCAVRVGRGADAKTVATVTPRLEG
jgi:transposase